MGLKDHLGTTEESRRRKDRDLKKVISVSYQGNPPVFTGNLSLIGQNIATAGAIRDTDFPILKDIDDQAQGFNLDTYNLDLSKQDAHFHRIIIGDEDEFAVAITNIDVFFNNLAKNKELQFTIEFVKDPAIVTDPTVTFSPPLEGVPAGFPDDFDVWYFLISGRTLPDNTTRFELLNVGTGSGGGNTFPILYPEENLGTIGFITQVITVSGNDGQFKEITMNGDVDIAFAGLPAGTVLEEWWILFIQDNVGGHGLTSTTSTLKNAGLLNSLIDKTADARTLFHFATGDGGTSIHGELVDLTASGGAFSGNLSDLVIDVDKDWNGKNISNLGTLDLFSNAVANGIFNVDVITFISNAAASRGQIGRSDAFGTSQGLAVNIMAGDNFVIAVDTIGKVEFNDTLGQIRTDYDLNMKGNLILLDADGDTFIDGSTDDVIDFATGGSLRVQIANTGVAITVPTTSFVGDVQIFTGTFKMFSGQISAGGAGVGMDNIGNLVFVSNLATPAAGVAIYSDGTFLKAKSNALAGNIMLNPQIEDLNMGLFNILSTQVPTGLNQFRIIFDGHEDSDTYFRNTSVNPDRIVVVIGGINTATFSTSAFNLFDPIDMNTNDIQDVGNMDFGGGSASSGRIRLPAGGAGAIKWESSPAGFDGEMYFDNDFNWFVDSGGTWKYFEGGFERFRIGDSVDFFVDADMNNNDIVRIQALGFNDLGGLILVTPNLFNFVTTSPLGIFRFTPQTEDILDITEDGLLMKGGNLDMANTNILRANRLEFAVPGQNIFDSVNALTVEVGSGDTINLVVNGNTTLEINDNFCDFFENFWDMTARTGFLANPPVNQRRVFVDLATGELSVRTATGATISLEQGGGGGVSDRIESGNALAIVQAETFQVFTSGVERFNINPAGQIFLLGDSFFVGNLDINTNFIQFDGIPVPTTVTGEPKLFANSSNLDHLSIKSGDGSVIDLEVGGGGGGPGIVSDTIIGLLGGGPNGEYLDNLFKVIGSFSSDNLGIPLPTAKPALPNISHTVTAADFPTGINGMTYDTFGWHLELLVRKTFGADKEFSVSATVNEVEVAADAVFQGSAIGTFFGGADWGLSRSQNLFQNILVGDRIGAKVWITVGGLGLELEDFQQWIMPNKMEVNSQATTIEIDFTAVGSGVLTGDVKGTPAFGIKDIRDPFNYNVGGGEPWNDLVNVNFSNRLLITGSGAFNNCRGAQSSNLRSVQTVFTNSWFKHRRVSF